jgi:hypothetical protein
MTERYPMLPPAADRLDSFSQHPATGRRESESRISDSHKAAEGLSRRVVLAGVASAAALPMAAAVPIGSSPEASPDQALIEVGKRFDERVAKYYYYAHLDTQGMSEAEIHAIGDAQWEIFETDDLFYEIGRAEAHTIEGCFVKARAVAASFPDLWDEPFDELDWGPKNTRMLVESIFKTAGGLTVKQYLSGGEAAAS